SQSYSDTVEQTKKTHGMEDEEHVKDAEEAPAPGQDYLRTSKQGHNPSLYNRHQIFYQPFGNVNPEEEPTPTESRAEQRVNPAQQFGYNLLVNSSSPASTMQQARAGDEGSSAAVPPTTATNWKPQGEGFSFHNKPVSSDRVLGQGELFESQVDAHLHPLVPDEALRTFLAGMARALQVDCRLPQLQLPCTKLLSRTGQLIKLLSEKQNNQGASALTNQCLLGENFSIGMARDTGGKDAEERNPEHTSSDKLLLAVLVSFIIMVNLMGICLIEVCSQARAAASQPQSHSKSPPRW
ncbi:L37A2 protein, partial [Oreotrochilus melanogaster]|nr:L37A2 protein [Oreotrochilus melanogaster]